MTRGHVILLLVVGLFVANAVLLRSAQSKVSAEERAAAEAAKPAEVTLTLITAPDCTQCFDPTRLTSALESNAKIRLTGKRTLTYASDEGKALAASLNLSQAPALVIDGQIDKLLTAASYLSAYGLKAGDRRYVVSKLPPPYQEIASGAVRGLFSATYLSDTECQECYDVRGHRNALAGIGLTPSEEKTVDRSEPEGKELIQQYGIESTPTLLIRGDVGVYPALQNVWTELGTIESDGTYVFRAGQAQMGTYYDLKTKTVIKAAESTPPETSSPQP